MYTLAHDNTLWFLSCPGLTAKNTGGIAPPTNISIEKRTMFGLALVLIVAVPIALYAYLHQRRKRVDSHRGYTVLPGDTVTPDHPSVTSV